MTIEEKVISDFMKLVIAKWYNRFVYWSLDKTYTISINETTNDWLRWKSLDLVIIDELNQ